MTIVEENWWGLNLFKFNQISEENAEKKVNSQGRPNNNSLESKQSLGPLVPSQVL